MYSGVPKLRVFAFVLALFGLIALSTGLAYGQATSGNIVGTVTDPSGATVVDRRRERNERRDGFRLRPKPEPAVNTVSTTFPLASTESR